MAAAAATPLIDCDIHPALPSTHALLPYLDDHWREQITTRGIDGFDLQSYLPTMPISGRPDWRQGDAKPGTSFEHLQTQGIDAFGSTLAICNCLYGVQAVYDPYLASAFCRAMNDWLAKEWLDRDPRLRASIVVPPQAIDLAVEEIERRAGDRRFVSILLLAMGEAPLGRRQFWPIYEAAQKHALPVTIHAGTSYRMAPTSAGWPSYRYEYYVADAQAFQAQLLSLVLEGVFRKFPGLKVVLAESGIAWLPAMMWRANKTWKGVRIEVPWVDRPPADIIRDHVRLTIQPFDAPADAASVERICEQIGSDRMLLFSTDYPHWQFDGGDPMPPHLPKSIVERMRSANALETYPRLN